MATIRLKSFRVTVAPAHAKLRWSKDVLAPSRDAAAMMVTAYEGDRVTTSSPGLFAELGLYLRHALPPSSRDLRDFYVELGAGLGASPSLGVALKYVLSSTTHPRFAVAISAAVAEANAAHGIDCVLDCLRPVLPHEHVERIRAAEATGESPTVVRLLERASERGVNVRGQLIQAAFMPAVTILVGTAAGVFLAHTQLPMLEKLFAANHAVLPLPSRVLLGIVKLAASSPVIGLAIYTLPVTLTLAVPKFYKQWGWLQDLVDRLPSFGMMLAMLRWSKLLRTLSMLLASHSPLNEALLQTAKATEHMRTRRFLLGVSKYLDQNACGLFEACRAQQHILGVVPMRWIDVLPIGAAAGDTASLLAKVADDYENRADNVLRLMPSVLTVVSIMVAGAIVGFVAAASILPGFMLNTIFK